MLPATDRRVAANCGADACLRMHAIKKMAGYRQEEDWEEELSHGE